MSVLADDLRANAKHWDRSVPGPLFNLKAQTFANTETSRAVPDNKATDHGIRGGLEMAFDAGINPAYDLTVQKSSQGDTIGRTRSLLDALTNIVRRAGITQLTAKFGGFFCVADHEPADRELQAVSFRGCIHRGIIAPSGSVFPISRIVLSGPDGICMLCFYRFHLGIDDGDGRPWGF